MVMFLLLLPTAQGQTVVLIGDSLTEGYGVKTEEAYPAQLEKMFHAQGKSTVKIINGGISGSTTANSMARVKWFLRSKPEVMIFALGANDGLRGLKITESQKNLRDSMSFAQSKGVKVLLAPMKLPTNYGDKYRREFEAMYNQLSRELKIPLLGFMLEGVGGEAKYNLADGIHPNPEGHKKVAENMYRALKDHL
jgi:acyl-CoA thioesterase-1